ncbi:MAG: hypothetical protein QOE70_962 [Chthoniobacter sp.]|jgi:hypothetical protein|nr:hypothetical protein [Chthoniobacter sp.]
MTDIKGIPYTQVKFDKDGRRENAPQVPAGTTDLIVVSHGWNNTEDDAVDLYTKLFSNYSDQIKGDPAYKDRRVAILGVIWPAKKFDELMTQLIAKSAQDSGGAKSLTPAEHKAAQDAMHAAIDRAAPAFDDPGDSDRLAELHRLVPSLNDNAADQAAFVATLRELLDPQSQRADQQHDEDSSDFLFNADAEQVFQSATDPAPASAADPEPVPPQTAKAESGQALSFIGDVFSKAANAVTNLLNVSTYFEMKQRAGTVGKNGAAPLIDELAAKVDRIHLVGHSFGGRLVTATAANSNTSKLHSLSLLQAAFSHNGFSKKRGGFFREVVTKKRVNGPIFVTHTKKDTAVGLAYPAASRLSGDTGKAFGGPDDKFGGIGSNGAQQMEDKEISETAKTLLAVRAAYQWQAGKFHNLDSTEFIVDPNGGDAHGWVFVPEVAWAISRAVVS